MGIPLKTSEKERRQFKKDRRGARGRITYMAHGRDYVMARYPRCIPFCMAKSSWLSLPFWEKTDATVEGAK